jgi:3D (Asp-Asp-Asp) domain-containing protein
MPASGAEVPSYRLRAEVVAYHLPGRTASGLPTGVGIVAVDPKVIPLGTRLFVPRYGMAVAADTGPAIKGRVIDVWLPKAQARRWGKKKLIVTVFRQSS